MLAISSCAEKRSCSVIRKIAIAAPVTGRGDSDLAEKSCSEWRCRLVGFLVDSVIVIANSRREAVCLGRGSPH
jgi:hypothetical protein